MMDCRHPSPRVVRSQYSPDYILVDSDAKCKVDLLCYSWTAEGGIAPLYVDNSGDEFPGGTCPWRIHTSRSYRSLEKAHYNLTAKNNDQAVRIEIEHCC